MLKKLRKAVLFVKLVGYTLKLYVDFISRSYTTKKISPGPGTKDTHIEPINIVIIGASFAGYHAARLIASALPTDGPYRLIIVEPNQHWHFTWTLPRFCVIEGHAHKTFIPYGPYLPAGSESVVRWVRDRVSSINEKTVIIQGTGEEIPYSYLVIATGSGVGMSLPSRVGSTDKAEGVKLLQDFQQRIKNAKNLVVVGGGAAGVELATDAKDQYPEKNVTLVHSRDAVMNRFGSDLQAGALKGLKDLGIEVILGERTTTDTPVDGAVTLRSGRKLECDFLVSPAVSYREADKNAHMSQVNATGQQPSSQLISEFAPEAIAKSGRIKVKPTMQIDVESLPNVYVCGDVAETGVTNPNGRSAMKQATYAADNLVLALQGKPPTNLYQHYWADGVIKLTLGLHKSITAFGIGNTELLFHGQDKEITLMIERAWTNMGAKPYEDKEYEAGQAQNTAANKALEVVNEVL
ncbi:Apoptosis-inducing factor B-like protein [Colletotrichum chlorophyti]|uniref:Apoptosis-inducing factor B-like protein n=1 Tax=Colletotrichum chlorophyti TaxID=708187 RepID=A0A1Q8S3I8_9PEZI|nr:Apoptosis-inducing factor B-like protein [Colletotrichum chlorophyti]